jgi:hypothetical protein
MKFHCSKLKLIELNQGPNYVRLMLISTFYILKSHLNGPILKSLNKIKRIVEITLIEHTNCLELNWFNLKKKLIGKQQGNTQIEKTKTPVKFVNLILDTRNCKDPFSLVGIGRQRGSIWNANILSSQTKYILEV